MRLSPLIVALATSSLAACTAPAVRDPLAFTDTVARDYGLDDPQKRRLQYYTATAIRLVRLSPDRPTDTPRRDRSDEAPSSVTLPAGSAGVVVGAGPQWLAIRFQPGRWLYFACRQNVRRGTDDDRYYLYSPTQDGAAGTVTFGTARYQVLGESFGSYLVIDRATLQDGERRDSSLSSHWLDERVHP